MRRCLDIRTFACAVGLVGISGLAQAGSIGGTVFNLPNNLDQVLPIANENVTISVFDRNQLVGQVTIRNPDGSYTVSVEPTGNPLSPRVVSVHYIRANGTTRIHSNIVVADASALTIDTTVPLPNVPTAPYCQPIHAYVPSRYVHHERLFGHRGRWFRP